MIAPRTITVTRTTTDRTWLMSIQGTDAYGKAVAEPMDMTAGEMVAWLVTGHLKPTDLPPEAILEILTTAIDRLRVAHL